MFNTSNVQRFHFKKFTGATKQGLGVNELISRRRKCQHIESQSNTKKVLHWERYEVNQIFKYMC